MIRRARLVNYRRDGLEAELHHGVVADGARHGPARLARALLGIALVMASSASAQVPKWQVLARVETQPLAAGQCSWVSVDVRLPSGKLIPLPDGSGYVGAPQFELSLVGAAATRFKWARNTPGSYNVCAATTESVDGQILVRYPRTDVDPGQLRPNVAFEGLLRIRAGGEGDGVTAPWDTLQLVPTETGSDRQLAAAAVAAPPTTAATPLSTPSRPAITSPAAGGSAGLPATPSSVGVVQTPAPPPAPAGVAISLDPQRRPVISWSSVVGASGYLVNRYGNTDAEFAELTPQLITTTSTVDGGTALTRPVRYQVCAVNAAGQRTCAADVAFVPPIRGFVDLHNHIFSYLGFGGRAIHGRAFGPIDQALAWCTTVHGPGGVGDILGNLIRSTQYSAGFAAAFGHAVGGYPLFDGWPRWDNLTHQAVHADWLKRAVDGGLRVMVALAVNDEKLCDRTSHPGRGCSDAEAVQLQLDEAWAMQAYIDGQAGGPGKGWFRIVTSAAEARTVLGSPEPKLAVILGVEVNDPLSMGWVREPQCWMKGPFASECGYPAPSQLQLSTDPAVMRSRLDALYAKGVRYLFPVHFTDDAFAGTARQNGLQWDVQQQVGDDWQGIAWAPAIGGISPPDLARYASVQVEDCRQHGFTAFNGTCNRRGLTPLGGQLMREMFKRAMIVDVDHMSRRGKDEVFGLADQLGYPAVVAGHSGFSALSLGEHNHEGQLTTSQVARIRALGGMISVILRQGELVDIRTFINTGTVIPHACGNSIQTFAQAYLFAAKQGIPVGFGTDFNGMIPPFGPRLGPEQCRGGGSPLPSNLVDMAYRKPNAAQPLPYPFTARATGVSMGRSVAGQRTFDVAADGVAHMGLLPDVIADLEWLGATPQDLEPLLSSAESFLRMWERADARARSLP